LELYVSSGLMVIDPWFEPVLDATESIVAMAVVVVVN
jgi:hypothetical protein